MREFKSVQDFVEQLSKDVQQSLRTEVANDVVDLAIGQAQKEIYDVYTPAVYQRRYSFIDRDLWTYLDWSDYLDGYTLEVVNLATPNPFNNGEDLFATTDKYLPSLIELGHLAYTTRYGHNGYDFTSNGDNEYMHPRPFASTTSQILSGNDNRSFKHSLEKSLKTKGYLFEK